MDGSNRVMSNTNSLVSLHRSESINYHLPCYPSSHTCNSLPSSLCRHNFHPTPSHHYNLPPPYHNSHPLSPPYYSHPHTLCHSPRWRKSPTSAPPCHCHSSPMTHSHDHPCAQTMERPLKEVVRNEQVYLVCVLCV